jgi:hypothetical protein
MKTILNNEINNDFKIYQDIKRITEQVKNFIKIYAYKSEFLALNLKDVKHNDYLNLLSRIYGFSDYNQFNNSKKECSLTLYHLLNGIENFLYSLPNVKKYNSEEIPQIINTLNIYLSVSDCDIKKYKSSFKSTITKQINKLLKEKEGYLATEIQRFWNIINNKTCEPLIIDYRGIIISSLHKPLLMNYCNADKPDYQTKLIKSMLSYYDYKNAMTIKKHLKDCNFDDKICKHLYVYENFIKKFYDDYQSYEYLEFMSEQYAAYHGGLNDSKWRDTINKFKHLVTEITIGKFSVYKGVFEIVNEDGKIDRNKTLARYREDDWSFFKLTLANQDEFEIHIYNEGILAIKDFNGVKESYNILEFNSDDILKWTIPVVERKGQRREEFKFFFPKFKDDLFIFKLCFKDRSLEVKLNQHGIFIGDADSKIEFKNIIENFYNKRINTLLKNSISKKKEFFKNPSEELKKEIDAMDEEIEKLNQRIE